MDATMAVWKLTISNPGTACEENHKSATLIRNAEMPKVRMEMGRATNCKIGLRSVLTIPNTIEATTAEPKLAILNPGTK